MAFTLKHTVGAILPNQHGPGCPKRHHKGLNILHLGASWKTGRALRGKDVQNVPYVAEENRAGKTSENTDGYSVSFDTSQSVDSLLYKIAYVYLGSTGLMDFGVDE